MNNIKAILIASLAILIILSLGWFLMNHANGRNDKTTDGKFKLTTSKLNENVTVADQLKLNDLSCGNWIAYEDEKCFKITDDTLRTFDEAVESCAKLGKDVTLAMIHSKEEQNFLSNYLFKTSKKLESFWIGAKFVNNKFHWINYSILDYVNWVAKGPRNRTNYCVQMQADEDSIGKWIDEPCEEKNLVVCQKVQSWSISRMQNIIIETRNMLKSVVPIGSIYSQLPKEKSPIELWPSMTWTDVSSTYAGVFFRVSGGDAASFGQIQTENAPHLDNIKQQRNENGGYKIQSDILPGQCSKWSCTGKDEYPCLEAKFCLSSGEVRPRNMAIRIWKRTG